MSRTAFCFDLDGTLTTTEILPCIAAELGVADEIATLTRLTMDGLVPFEDSMRLRTLILGQVPVARVHDVMASVPIASVLQEFVRHATDRCFVVTGNLNIWISPLIESLGCKAFSSQAKLIDGAVRLESVLSKDEVVHTLRTDGCFDRIVAIGDGANDAAMLRAADIGIAYGGVHAPATAAVNAADLVVHNAGALCKLLKAL
ncbi:HAD-IB family phosphatase [Ottowia sp. VDI28]|uniref:HAD-IB family phosphatase n=1 Tax=Ottowia sp. VDI28 TaxID=3133968 RepID=UPI003C2E96BA